MCNINPKFYSGDYLPLATFCIAEKQSQESVTQETASIQKDKFDVVVVETLSCQHIFIIEKNDKNDFIFELGELFGFPLKDNGYRVIKLKRDPILDDSKKALFMFSQYPENVKAVI